MFLIEADGTAVSKSSNQYGVRGQLGNVEKPSSHQTISYRASMRRGESAEMSSPKRRDNKKPSNDIASILRLAAHHAADRAIW